MKIFMSKDKLLLAAAMFMGGISAMLSAFISVLLQQIIDVAAKKDMHSFSDLFIVMLLYLISLGVIGFLEAYLGKLLIKNVTSRLRKDIFHGIITKNPEDFTSRNTADYLSVLLNDVKLVEENYLTPLMLCTQMAVLFLSTLGLLLYLSWASAVILVLSLLLMFLLPSLLGGQMKKRQDIYSEKLAAFTSCSKELLSGYEVIRGYSMYSSIFRKFQASNLVAAKKKFSADTLLAVNECASDILSAMSVIVIVFVSAWQLLKGQITMGTLLALIQLGTMFMTPVVILMQNIPKIRGIAPVLNRLKEFTDSAPSTLDPALAAASPKTGTAPWPFTQELLCQGLSFKYTDGRPILDNLSFSIKPGGKYALLGESGCGKSTLIRLLTGYSMNFSGTISYDGKSVKDFSPDEMNRLTAVIHQNVFLFDADIYYNICLGETFTQEALQAALEDSGVTQFLPSLEKGLSSETGENGCRLSGGQRQRIAVARALIRRTPILIIDEGTSAVDQETAFEIESRLLKKRGLTVITITHHMNETLRPGYDQILTLHQGHF